MSINQKQKKNNLFIISQKKKIYFKYNIIKNIETGIILKGWEVKSIKEKKIDITNSYITIKNKEIFITNIILQPLISHTNYKKKTHLTKRKLLLKKEEIDNLIKNIKKDKLTAVILSIYWKNHWIKINIGIAKRIKKYKKKERIKTQEWKKDQQRITKTFFKKS